MIFGHNYFDVLTSRFGGASNIWNRQGLSNVNSMSKTSGVRGSSRTTSIGNSYYGLSANTIKAMNNVYNTTANKLFMADVSVADGAVKVENAGRKLSYEELYQDKNTEELLKTVKNFVEGYNEIIPLIQEYMEQMVDMEVTAFSAAMADIVHFFHQCSQAGSNEVVNI